MLTVENLSREHGFHSAFGSLQPFAEYEPGQVCVNPWKVFEKHVHVFLLVEQREGVEEMISACHMGISEH
jgi:hypothetical protein